MYVEATPTVRMAPHQCLAQAIESKCARKRAALREQPPHLWMGPCLVLPSLIHRYR